MLVYVGPCSDHLADNCMFSTVFSSRLGYDLIFRCLDLALESDLVGKRAEEATPHVKDESGEDPRASAQDKTALRVVEYC